MKLKVFGWSKVGRSVKDGRCQYRAIVATTSWKAAAVAAKQPLGSFRGWASITANAEDIKLAMSSPGTVFVRPLDKRGPDGWRAET